MVASVKVSPEFSWLNEISVRVAYGELPDRPPAEVFSLLLSDPDLGKRPWDDDAFVAELEPLLWQGKSRDMYDRNSYTLDVKKAHGSWGADGAAGEILLYIANHAAGGLVDAGVVALVLRVFRELKAKVGDSRQVSVRTPEEVAEFARWRIQVAFRDWLAHDTELKLTGEVRDVKGVWTGSFIDADGNTYGIDIHLVDGSTYATRVTRKTA